MGQGEHAAQLVKWCHHLVPEEGAGAAGVARQEIAGVGSSLAMYALGDGQESGQRHVTWQQLERAH